MRAQEAWLLYQLTANKGILASEEESNNTATAPAMVGQPGSKLSLRLSRMSYTMEAVHLQRKISIEQMGGSPHSLTGSGRSLGGRCVWVGFVCLPSNMNLEESPQKPWRMTKKDRLIGLGVRTDYPAQSATARTASKRFDDDTTTLREGITSGNSLRKNKQAERLFSSALRQLNQFDLPLHGDYSN